MGREPTTGGLTDSYCKSGDVRFFLPKGRAFGNDFDHTTMFALPSPHLQKLTLFA